MVLPSSWQEILILMSVIQGVFLCIVLSMRIEARSPANRVLIWFILSLIFLLSAGIPVESHILILLKKGMSYVGDSVSFLYGPLLFMYTYRLLLKGQMKNRKYHFLPAIVFFSLNIIFEVIGFEQFGDQFFEIYFSILSTFFFIQIIIYLALSIRLITFYKKSIDHELSYTPSINYLATIVSIIGFCVLLFLVDFVAEAYGLGVDLTFMNYHIAWMSISLLTFILAYYAIAQPALFRIMPVKENSNVIDISDLKRTKTELLNQMENQKLYLDPELSLLAIANLLGRRKEIISKVINQGLNKNFYQFVNEYRIEEFKQLVEQQDKKHITHLGLAFEAGFKSKTTFYKAFKEIVGSTPAQYLKSS